ncbi:MAG: hypothetical protein IPP14_00935 [Planctomycetes bacterium]|nr:hypothetical protein [Planctomycetota bacterium]
MGLTQSAHGLLGYVAIGAKGALLFAGAAFGSFVWNAMTAPVTVRADDKPDTKADERARLKKASMGDIVCRSFRVIDADGNARVYMGVTPEGMAQFGAYSQEGLAGVLIGVTNENSSIDVLVPRKGTPPGMNLVTSTEDDSAFMEMWSEKERNLIRVETDRAGSKVQLTSSGGKDDKTSSWATMFTSGDKSTISVTPHVPNDPKITSMPAGSIVIGFKKDEPMGMTLTGDKPVFWPPK